MAAADAPGDEDPEAPNAVGQGKDVVGLNPILARSKVHVQRRRPGALPRALQATATRKGHRLVVAAPSQADDATSVARYGVSASVADELTRDDPAVPAVPQVDAAPTSQRLALPVLHPAGAQDRAAVEALGAAVAGAAYVVPALIVVHVLALPVFIGP